MYIYIYDVNYRGCLPTIVLSIPRVIPVEVDFRDRRTKIAQQIWGYLKMNGLQGKILLR